MGKKKAPAKKQERKKQEENDLDVLEAIVEDFEKF